MSLEKNKNIIKKQLQEIKDEDKLIIFNNPDRFCRLFLERTNPNHVGFVWGLKTRKERKKHGKSIIKVAKVYFANQVFFFSETIKAQIDYFLNIMPNATVSCLVCSFASILCFYYLMFKLSKLI